MDPYLEHIAKHPQTACEYAIDIGQRWPEGEVAIATSPRWACVYAHQVIKGRFPRGEESILSDPMRAYEYAFNILQKRWPQGEVVIKNNIFWWEKYKYRFGIEEE